MSQILSKDTKEVICRKVRKLEGIKCDICHNELRVPYSKDGQCTRPYPQYFKVTTGHNDWGNDSIDSIQVRDMCPECALSFVKSYLEFANGTDYIEIETKHCCPMDVVDEVDEDN